MSGRVSWVLHFTPNLFLGLCTERRRKEALASAHQFNQGQLSHKAQQKRQEAASDAAALESWRAELAEAKAEEARRALQRRKESQRVVEFQVRVVHNAVCDSRVLAVTTSICVHCVHCGSVCTVLLTLYCNKIGFPNVGDVHAHLRQHTCLFGT